MIKFPQPINEFVIILPDEAKVEEKKEGAFFVPDELQDKPRTGTVMAASEGYYAKETGTFIPLEVKKDYVVLYSAFGGAPLTLDGEKYLLMKQSDISLILKK